VVGIENPDDVEIELCEGVVDVACLRVCVLCARDIARAERRCHRAHPKSLSIIQHIRFMTGLQRDGRGDRREKDLHRVVVRGDQDTHAQIGLLHGRRDLLPVEVPQRKREQPEAHRGVQFQDPKRQRDPQAPAQREAHPPGQVDDAHYKREHGHDLDRAAARERLWRRQTASRKESIHRELRRLLVVGWRWQPPAVRRRWQPLSLAGPAQSTLRRGTSPCWWRRSTCGTCMPRGSLPHLSTRKGQSR